VASASATGPLPDTGLPLLLGNNGFDESFVGLIDEVRIYALPLTASEIQSLMDMAVAQPPPPAAPQVPANSLYSLAILVLCLLTLGFALQRRPGAHHA